MNKDKENKTIIVVAGPTAVGKTSVSIELAKSLQCDIISADSRQVYIEMNTGTAKPTAEELKNVNYHFINNVSIISNYDVGLYEKGVKSFLERYFIDNDIVILTGGTGLYIEAVINGLDKFPDVNNQITMRLNKLFKEQGIEELQRMLEKSDPSYYKKVDLHNPHRLIRALSVYEQTGIPYSNFLNGKTPNTTFNTVNVLLELPRNELYDRINNRVDIMIKNGLIEEVKQLYEFRDYKALNTVGYKELFDYFDEKISLEEAIRLIKRNSRRYAKRQMTWFNNRGEWNVFSPYEMEKVLGFIKTELRK